LVNTQKVTVLITAESLIAGFMIAYSALNGQLLVDWFRHGGSLMLMPTYIAGIAINAIILTFFVSIILLVSSVPSPTNTKKLRGRYDAGYDLFLTAILGSALFVVANSLSIHHFTVESQQLICLPAELANVVFKEFLAYGVLLGLMVLFVFPGLLPLRALDNHATIIALLCFAAIAAMVVYYYVPGAIECSSGLFAF
jgi:hypothetical protein